MKIRKTGSRREPNVAPCFRMHWFHRVEDCGIDPELAWHRVFVCFEGIDLWYGNLGIQGRIEH